ncbi:MAG: ABC transporter substrate-binding protein [Pseudonocardiaceae bacterium]|nr:ABC transporter substrate-binding protein [Pseudonocardiaceae bacterium]
MRYHRQLRSLAVLCAAGLLLTACGGGRGGGDAGGQDPGITESEVKLGGSYPLSGPASAYATIAQATQACFEQVNAEGGVRMGDGVTRNINFIVYDDGYEPARMLENTRRLVEQDRVFALFDTLGTPTNSAIVDYVNERQVPHLYLATGASKWGSNTEEWPMTIGWQPAYSLESAIYAEYLKRERPGARVAVLYQNDDFGKDYLNGFKQAIEGSGIQIVAEETYQVTDPSVDSQVVNLSRSNADVFFNITTPKFAAQAIARKAEIGWDAMHLLNSVSTSVGSVMEPAGAEASQGIISAEYIKDPSDPRVQDDPAMQEYKAAAEQYGDFNIENEYGTFGFAVCNTMVKTLEQTEEPTREALMEAVRSIDAENPLLIDGIRVKTGEGDGFPIESMQLQRFEGERWVPFSDVISRYEGNTPAGGGE